MSALIGLKIKRQHQLGHFLDTKEALDAEKSQMTLGNVTAAVSGNNVDLQTVKSPKDGYWVLLQDWSQCTLKCGGGLQYQQLMCVPPKDGGKNCVGESIRSKPCNIQPCPTEKNLKRVKLNMRKLGENGTTLKPIVKAMRVSQRPTRYDKCHIKEGDALMTRESHEASQMGYEGIKETFPARLVMNNKTLTIYQDESYKTILGSFLLESTKLLRMTTKKNCFQLKSLNKLTEVCEIQGSKNNFVEEWDYDFNLFKYQCKSSRPEIQIGVNEEKKLENEFKEKVAEAKVDIVRERQAALKKAVQQKDELLIKKKVQGTQSMTLQAVHKELQLEEMLEKEEKAREALEIEEINADIEKEKKKKECLLNMIKERQLEDQYNLGKQESEKQVFELKEEAKKEIMIKRNKMKTKIMNLRKKNERKKKICLNKN